MIKAVLFDFFGVLTEGGGSLRRVFADAYGMSPGNLQYDRAISSQALKGRIADEDFISEINRQNPDAPPFGKRQFEVREGYPVMCKPVHELIEELRTHGIKTGVVSNTLQTMADSLRKHGLYDGFSPLLLSCEVNLAKPDPVLYRMAVHQLGVKPEEVIFIDDMQVNLEPAKQMGMHVILAKDPEQIVRDTKALIFKENGVTL